ncbi:HEAT repeat domain-containing protein, partial [Microcoleus anatoxicus]
GMLNETSRFQLRESVGYRVMGASQFELACRLGWLNLVARDGETLEGIYAFYHPTFQEYFAALAVEDSHFFLNHISTEGGHGGTAPTGVYRIFEKQWKEVILLWLGREEVGKEEKEGFIKALVEFEDGCDDFYGYRAYFLAAAGIAEFKDCSLADEIVSQVIKWGFGYFDEEIQQWVNVNKIVSRTAKEILKEIDRKRAVAALAKLIRNSSDELTRRVAAENLGGIGKDNPVVSATLVELIHNSSDEFTRLEAAQDLGKIEKHHPVAIATLADLIRNSINQSIRMRAASSLGEIDKDNSVASAALVELIRNSSDGYTRREAASSLGKIGKNNPEAIAALVELIRNSGDEYTRWEAAASLGKIDKDNSVALSTLVELICNSGDENIQSLAVYSLGEIDTNNPEAIAVFFELLRYSSNKVTRKLAAASLLKIGKYNREVFAKLAELIRNLNIKIIRSRVTKIVGEIRENNSNPEEIAALVELIRNSGNVSAQREAAYKLRKIMKGKHFATAVSGLKDCLTSEVHENDYNLYKICYQVIWDCAENMTYPEFHQAWHTQPTNSPIPDNHRQNTDIPTLLKQLQPTDKTCPVPLNIRALEGETDTSAIAQEICTQLYQTIFPADTDIPAIRNAPEFKRLIPQLKNRLQKQHIALILHSSPCEDTLSSFTRKLADTQMGIHIAWITDTPLELPLTGFAVDADDLLNALHNWMEGIG